MAVTVNWLPYIMPVDKVAGPAFNELQIICQEPESFYKHIANARKESKYLKCYAFIDTLKNAFIIKSPIDFKLKYNREAQWLSVDGITQEFYNNFVFNRTNDYGETDPVLLSLFPRYVFYSDSPVQMTCLPLPLIGEPENTRMVVGGFDIQKWIRPISWTFEMVDDKKVVEIKRNDPLFMVVFSTENNEAVRLNRVLIDKKLDDIIEACSGVKRQISNLPLKKCYEIAESFLGAWRKYRSK